MPSQYVVRAVKGVSIWQVEPNALYLKMNVGAFSSKQDCIECAKLIADFLTQAQRWAGALS
jgi:hypothetical protein